VSLGESTDNVTSFLFQIEAGKYSSNCLHKDNFPNEYSKAEPIYFFVNLMLDAQSSPSVTLRIALDDRYPSELVVMEKEDTITKKDLLKFVMHLVNFLSPKNLYFFDSSNVASDSRIIGPVIKRKNFYEHYGEFELVNTSSLLSLDGKEYNQNREQYARAIEYLYNFPIDKLLVILDKRQHKYFSTLLDTYPDANKKPLSYLMQKTFKEDDKQNFYFLVDRFLSVNKSSVIDNRFYQAVHTLNKARLWVWRRPGL
jgi:hypothetical protein